MLTTVPGFDRIGEENAFAVLARAGALMADGKDVINLGIGQPDFPTPPHIAEAAVRAIRDGHHGYTPATGLPELREAVAADLHRRHAAQVSPDNVLIVPGGKVTMFAAILMFGEPGAEILYPDRRGDGYALARFNDKPTLDCSRLTDCDDVHFAHARGFVAKTSATEVQRLKELLALAQVAATEPLATSA